MKILLIIFAFCILFSCQNTVREEKNISIIVLDQEIDSTIYKESNGVALCSEKLISACRQKNIARLQDLIEQGCNVNETSKLSDKRRNSPLRESIRIGDTAIIKFLLKNGADPNLFLGDYMTSFHYAAGFSLNILNILYEHGGDVMTVNPNLNFPTLISWAVIENKPKNVKFLLEKGAPIYPDSLDQESHPILTAVQRADIDLISLFIENGISINKRYPLHLEDYTDSITLVTSLIDNYHYNYENNRVDLLKLLEFLVTKGADIYHPWILGEAIKSNDTIFVNTLLDYGVPIENEKYSALFSATYQANYLMTRHLLKLGANPNFKLSTGAMPIHYIFMFSGDGFGARSSKYEKMETFKILVDNGADINAKNSEGISALEYVKLFKYETLLDSLTNYAN